MEEIFSWLLGDLQDITMITEFSVLIRIIVFCIVVESLGVVCGNISSLGR